MKINNISNTLKNNVAKIYPHKKDSVSFEGGPIDTFFLNRAKSLANAAKAETGIFPSLMEKFSRTNSFKHLLAMESVFLSGFYMINTLRNKKIEKEQKPQMIINDALTLGVATTGAYLLDDNVTKIFDHFTNSHFKKNQQWYIDRALEIGKNAKDANPLKDVIASKDNIIKRIFDTAKDATDDGIKAVTSQIGTDLRSIVVEGNPKNAFQISDENLKQVQDKVATIIKNNKGNMEKAKIEALDDINNVYNKVAGKIEADKIAPGLRKIKTLIVFGLIYRYLGPVVVTPIANKLSSKFFSNKKEGTTQTQQKK